MSLSSPADAAALLRAARQRARARPWLLAPPLAGVAARALFSAALSGQAGAAQGALAGAVVTVAACAAFSEIWLSEGAGWDWPRVGTAGLLFSLPLFALAVVGLATFQIYYMALHSGAQAPARALLLLTFATGKIASGAVTVLASLALGSRRPGRGFFSALRAGMRRAYASAGLWTVLVLGSWAVQEAVVGLLNAGLRMALSGAAGSVPPASFRALGFGADAAVTLIALAACVALPLQSTLMEPE
ncbi:MAG: hypothetical protein HKL90_15895 [Elusimicrobia bacterium]|nr:hypothetical protein [Elusimicrobiota bacterium]